MSAKYYLEGSKILFEARNCNMLYYIYNNLDIVGVEYQDKKQYYHKNNTIIIAKKKTLLIIE